MNIYKKTLIISTVFVLFLFEIFYLITGFNSSKHILATKEASRNEYWYSIKNNYANNIVDQNKIVILSGSNSLFGVNTKKIEEELNIPTVNYGTHGGLGNYIFYSAKNILKSGDIVLLPLEYPFYSKEYLSNHPVISNTLCEYIVSFDYSYLNSLPIMEKQKIVSYLMFNLDKFELQSKITFGDTSYDILNKNGDNTSDRDVDVTFKKNNTQPSEILYEIDKNHDSSDLVKFISWCKLNNIKLYALAPNYYHNQKITPKEKEYFNYISDFYKKNNVEFLGEFQDGFYDLNDMYDTDYHLNSKGQEKRTEYIIKILAPIINSKKEFQIVNSKTPKETKL